MTDRPDSNAQGQPNKVNNLAIPVAPVEGARMAPTPGHPASPDKPAAPPAGDASPDTAPAPGQPGQTAGQPSGLPPTKREPDEAIMPEDTVRLAYELVLYGGREEVVRVKSQLVLPLALAVENLPQTDVTFPELLDQVITRPVVAKFRAFLQRCFAAAEAATQEEAAEPPAPPPANPECKRPQPTPGAPFTLPAIESKPPLPPRPSHTKDWPK